VSGAGEILVGSGRPHRLLDRRPALFETGPLDPASALGALFAPRAAGVDPTSDERRLAAATVRRLGELSPALLLLPSRERSRAAILGAWIDALFATALEGDRPEKRIDRLHRSAFLLARALAGESVESPFAERFAAESARREFGRRALDILIAEARSAVRRPLEAIAAEASSGWDERSRQVAGAMTEALLGQEPTAATVDAAQALLRLVRLASPAAGGVAQLSPEERAVRITVARVEAETIHPLLLRGARAIGEVPLTFRRALAALMTLGLQLLGAIESHPERALERAPRLGRFSRAWTLYRIRRDKLV